MESRHRTMQSLWFSRHDEPAVDGAKNFIKLNHMWFSCNQPTCSFLSLSLLYNLYNKDYSEFIISSLLMKLDNIARVIQKNGRRVLRAHASSFSFFLSRYPFWWRVTRLDVALYTSTCVSFETRAIVLEFTNGRTEYVTLSITVSTKLQYTYYIYVCVYIVIYSRRCKTVDSSDI